MTPPKKHPYGRLASIRHGAVQLVTGLVTVLTLGEVQPHWVLTNALNTSLRAYRKMKEANR